jgi:hypothetical protein
MKDERQRRRDRGEKQRERLRRDKGSYRGKENWNKRERRNREKETEDGGTRWERPVGRAYKQQVRHKEVKRHEGEREGKTKKETLRVKETEGGIEGKAYGEMGEAKGEHRAGRKGHKGRH